MEKQISIKVLFEIVNNKAIGKIITDSKTENDKYAFYLVKDGILLKKTDFSDCTECCFDVSETGMYYIRGYLKRDNNIISRKSKVKGYFNTAFQKSFEKFLLQTKEKTSLNTPLEFCKTAYPNQDFILISYKDNSKVDLKQNNIYELANNINLLYDNSLPKIGEYKNTIISEYIDSFNESRYCFSGITIIDDKYIHGYKDLAKSQKYDELDNAFGLFSFIKIENNKIKIMNDFFNFQPIYYYMDEDTVIFSNRYHLLLESMNAIGIVGDFNLDKFIVNLSNYSILMHQTVSKELDIIGCRQLDNRFDAVLTEKGWQFEENEYGEILDKPYGVTNEEFNHLISEGCKEIVNQLEVLINDESSDNVIIDLSGGLDSRLVYSALTNIKNGKDRVKIRSIESGNDLPIALTINSIYRYDYDDISVLRKPISLCEADNMCRSIFLGTYYSYNNITSLNYHNGIRCIGACGETVYRPYNSMKVNSNKFILDDYIEDIHQWICDNQIIGDNLVYDKFVNVFRKEFAETGGKSLCEILDRMYLELRHNHHFSILHPNNAIEKRWFPLQSKAIFELQHLYYDKLTNSYLQMCVINKLNPLLTWIPYDSQKDNDDFQNLKDRIDINNVFYDISLNIDIENEIISWKQANSNKKIQYISEKYNDEYKAYDDILYRACLCNLYELGEIYSTFKNELGMCVYYYICNNKNATKRLKNIYNKMASALDQIKIFEKR